jgi:hypothetical protein
MPLEILNVVSRAQGVFGRWKLLATLLDLQILPKVVLCAATILLLLVIIIEQEQVRPRRLVLLIKDTCVYNIALGTILFIDYYVLEATSFPTNN